MRADFFAASGAGSLTSKRKTVETLLRAAYRVPPETPSADLYPLSIAIVEKVSGALKHGDYQAADQYVGELRIAHIESGAEIPAPLARMFAKCRRSVTRGLGPPQRAEELPLEDTLVDIADEVDDPEGLVDPGPSYVIAESYLMREIEVANTELGHVAFYWERDPDHAGEFDDLGMEDAWAPPPVSNSTDEESGDLVAELCLPVSKTDYRGTGARRRLRCNCKGVGQNRCAPHVLRRQHRRRALDLDADPDSPDDWPEQVKTAPLFPNADGSVPSKKKVIEGWQRLVPLNSKVVVSGHTPRRSGAKRRAREGWELSIIMMLGRWASAAIMGYVEEALAELPVSGDGSRRKKPPTNPLDDWEMAVPALEERLKAMGSQLARVRERMSKSEAKVSEIEQKAVAAAPEPLVRRFLKSTRPNGKIHREASRASEDTPTWAMTTGCGWRFGLSLHYEWITETEFRQTEDRLLCDKGCDVLR